MSRMNAQRLMAVAAPVEDESSLAMNRQAEQVETSACSLCFGTGMEVVAGKGARRCGCRQRDRRARLIEAAHIPRRFSDCSLSNYHPAKNY
ncbi:MAG TPA: hypothetical protein VF766_06055, partial [Pyrinomonadaceae bacterium]